MHQSERPAGFPEVPKQENLERATELGLKAARLQSEQQLRWLGLEPSGDEWVLPVLGEKLTIDLSSGRIATAAGEEISASWRILVLHYMVINEQLEDRRPSIVFADLPESRTYAGIYQGRVISRLCGTVGRDGEALRAAALSLEGKPFED